MPGMAGPPFERVHTRLLVSWVVVWAVIVLVWWSQNGQGGGFFGSGFVALLAGVALAFGGAVIAGLALIARYLLAGQTIRTAFLAGVPLVTVVWLFAVVGVQSSGYLPADTLPTGLTVGYVPEGFYPTSESQHIQRGRFNVFRSETEAEELTVGVLGPDVTLPAGETVRRGEMDFVVTVSGEHNRVTRTVDGVAVEVASKALSAETLVSVSASITYDPRWDSWGSRP